MDRSSNSSLKGCIKLLHLFVLLAALICWSSVSKLEEWGSWESLGGASEQMVLVCADKQRHHVLKLLTDNPATL